MTSDRKAAGYRRRDKKHSGGFTLLELLVVIGIITLLMAVILPSVRKVRHQAQMLVCTSNLRQIGVAIHAYAQDFDDTIPFGPEGLPPAASNFYTATGNVTSLLSLYDGSPVGLGLLIDGYVEQQPKVLFCPGSDQPTDAEAELANVGKHQAEGGYYYRHASVAIVFQPQQIPSPPEQPDTFHIRLSRLGKNRNDLPITALVMDTQFLAHPSLEIWSVMTRTSHRQKINNVYYADGQVIRHDNSEAAFTVDIGNYPYDALDKILQVFELADALH